MYIYSATVTRVVDGDTFDAIVDLGFSVQIRVRFRVAGINSPELRGESRAAGQAAKDYLESLILGRTVKIKSMKTEKYGRWLADLILDDGMLLAEQMIHNGHAQPYP